MASGPHEFLASLFEPMFSLGILAVWRSPVHQPLLESLVEGLAPEVFLEVAQRVLGARNYGPVANADGWNDGGRDLRVYSPFGPTIIPIAV